MQALRLNPCRSLHDLAGTETGMSIKADLCQVANINNQSKSSALGQAENATRQLKSVFFAGAKLPQNRSEL